MSLEVPMEREGGRRARIHDVAAVEESTYPNFLDLLLRRKTTIANRLRNDLEAAKKQHAAFLDIWWKGLVALEPDTPSGTEIRRGKASNIACRQGDHTPSLYEQRSHLENVGGAIAFREAVKAVGSQYQLPNDVLPCLHR